VDSKVISAIIEETKLAITDCSLPSDFREKLQAELLGAKKEIDEILALSEIGLI
jgi:hypothetical protein